MTPALFRRTSRRGSLAVKVSAADLMEAKEVRSSSRKVICASGTRILMSAMAASALEGVRAAR